MIKLSKYNKTSVSHFDCIEVPDGILSTTKSTSFFVPDLLQSDKKETITKVYSLVVFKLTFY